jgi:hypothetical protein
MAVTKKEGGCRQKVRNPRDCVKAMRLTESREMQLFLLGYIVISICEIFTIGGFPLNSTVRIAFTAIHIAAITATSWILMLNGAVGYQLLDDGTIMSIGLLLVSSLVIFIGTGFIALDTGFSWTGFWDSTRVYPNQAYALYTLYQLVPLVFIVIFFLLEAFLVLRILGERKPMRMSSCCPLAFTLLTSFPSIPPRRGSPFRHRSNLPVRDQRPHLPRYQRQDQRRPLRDALHTPGSSNDLGVLVEHHRRRLADADCCSFGGV